MMLRYRDAFQVYERASKSENNDEMKQWKGSKIMDMVIDHDFELMRDRKAKC